METKELIKDIQSKPEKLKDPRRPEFAKTSYPKSMKVIGATVPN